MMANLLSLKWNNHKISFIKAISSLQNKNEYTDMVLACEGRFFEVHKFVLSVCSDYFKDIFASYPNKSSFLVIAGITSNVLEDILCYMYTGEVNINQGDLHELILAAEQLKIKGLAIPDMVEPKEEKNRLKRKLEESSINSPKKKEISNESYTQNRKKKRKSNSSTKINESPLSMENPNNEHTDEIKYIEIKTEETSTFFEQEPYDDLNEEKFFVDDFLTDSYCDPLEGGQADSHGFDSENKEMSNEDCVAESSGVIKTPHVILYEGKKKHLCQFCERPFRYPKDLFRHQRIHTGEKPFKCMHCLYTASRKDAIRQHMVTIHQDLSKDVLFNLNE